MKNRSKYIRPFLAASLVLGGWASTPVQATEDGEPKGLGFLIDGNFSTFIEVTRVDENGEPVREVILDIFEAVFSSNPGLDDLFTLEETQLDGVGGIVDGLPDVVAANVFTNVLQAFDDAGVSSGGGDPFGDIPQIVFNPDPFIAFNTTFTNPTDAPAEFSYNFLFPVIPVVGATEVVSQLSVDLIDADGDGSASLSLNGLDTEIQGVQFLEGGIFGGAVADIGFGVGTELTEPGETLFAPAITVGPEAGTAFDALTVFGRFTLSAGDSVTLTGLGGFVEEGLFLPVLADFNFDNFPSTVVPEPSSALLLLLGLATGLGRSRNRRT